MGIPVVYRKSGEGSIASYSFYDLSTGTGYKTFYGTAVIDTSTEVYALLSEALESNSYYKQSGLNTAMDIDFDMTVVIPQTISGVAYFNVPIGIITDTGTTTCTVKLYRVVGGVETQIGNTITKSFTQGGSPYANWTMVAGKVTVPTTTFQQNDIIRVSVATTAIAAANVLIYHSPKNTSAVTATDPIRTMSVSLPYRIDL